ncbi:MAG: phage major capsid protein [Actinomycetota bacterium]
MSITSTELPATLDGARIKLSELRGRNDEALDKLRDFIDSRGDTMTKADTEIADRLERRVDDVQSEIKSVQDRWPETREPSNIAVRQAALPAVNPRLHDLLGGVSDDAPKGVLGEFIQQRDGLEFDGAPASDFSLGKAIRGVTTGNWNDADLELRAMSIGTDTAGGHAVPTPLAGEVIDRVSARAVALQAGVRVVPMDAATQKFPRISSGVTGGWKAENDAVTVSDPALDSVTLTARTLAVATKLSYELLEDLSEAGAAAIENAITDSIAKQLDSAIFNGSGTAPEIRGIRNQSGITERTNGTNGASPSWSILNDAVAQVRQAGFNPNAVVLHPRTSAVLGNLTDTTGQWIARPAYLDGVQTLDTTSVPTNITTGSSSNTSIAIAGQFDQAILGVRPSFGIRVVQDASRYADSLSVLLVAYLRADVVLAQPTAFAVAKGIKAS